MITSVVITAVVILILIVLVKFFYFKRLSGKNYQNGKFYASTRPNIRL